MGWIIKSGEEPTTKPGTCVAGGSKSNEGEFPILVALARLRRPLTGIPATRAWLYRHVYLYVFQSAPPGSMTVALVKAKLAAEALGQRSGRPW
jgi:hypothetical protein